MREIFRTRVPEAMREKVARGVSLTRGDVVTSQRALNAEGIAVPGWPVEWGRHLGRLAAGVGGCPSVAVI